MNVQMGKSSESLARCCFGSSHYAAFVRRARAVRPARVARLVGAALLAVATLIVLAGCPGTGTGSEDPTYECQVTLWGYPSPSDSFLVELYMVGEEEVLETFAFEDVFTFRPFEHEFTAGPDVVAFVFYLTRYGTSGEPDWISWASYDHTVDEMTILYWFRYSELVNQDRLIAGISRDLAIPFSPEFDAYLDFYDAPYFLLEVQDPLSEPARMTLAADGGNVEVSMGAFNELYSTDFTLSPGNPDIDFRDSGFGTDWFVLLEPANYDEPIGVDVAFTRAIYEPAVHTLGETVPVSLDAGGVQFFRYESMAGRALEVELSVTEGYLGLVYGTDATDMLRDTWTSHSEDYYEIVDFWEDDTMLVAVRSSPSATISTGSVTIRDIPYLAAPGEISGMVACDDGTLVAALDYDNRSLLLIDADTQTITDTVLLPYLHPRALCYSAPDDTVYIVYYGVGAITPYNLTTGTFGTTLEFSTSKDGEHIEVEPAGGTRKLYVLAYDGFWVVDMDTGALLGETVDPHGHAMAVDGANEWLFMANVTYDRLDRYSITGDVLGVSPEEQTSSAYNSRSLVVLSPSKTRVVFPTSASYTPGLYLYSLDPADLSTWVDAWPISCMPSAVSFSPDEAYVYFVPATSDRKCLTVVDDATDQVLRELPFPFSHRNALIAATGDGNAVVGYSADTEGSSGQTNWRFHFFDDVRG